MKKNTIKQKDIVKFKSDIEMALMVSGQVQLKKVKVLECSARLIEFPKDGTNDYQVTASTHAQPDRDENVLLVFINMGLHAVTENGDALAKITSEFLLMYGLDKWDGLTDEHFRHFADHNGVFNAWPYWREMVQSMTSRLEIPPLTLPTHRFGVILPSEPTITKKKAARKKVSHKVTKKKAVKKTIRKKAKRKVAKKKATKK